MSSWTSLRGSGWLPGLLVPLSLLAPGLTWADAATPYSALSGGGHLGAFRYRTWGQNQEDTGYQLGGGQAPAVRFAPFYLGVNQGALARWFPGRGFAVGHTYDAWASWVLAGVLQPEVRVGLTSLMVDRLDQRWGVQIGSPRVAAGLSLRLGPVDLGVFAFREYSWRWVGYDLLLTGLYLDLRSEGKREYLD
jgi:hypothetical protein